MCFNCVISLFILNKLLMFRSPVFFFGLAPSKVRLAKRLLRGSRKWRLLVALPEIAESVESVASYFVIGMLQCWVEWQLACKEWLNAHHTPW